MLISALTIITTIVSVSVGWQPSWETLVADIGHSQMTTNLSQVLNYTVPLALISTWPNELGRWTKQYQSYRYVSLQNDSCTYNHTRDCADDRCIESGVQMYSEDLNRTGVDRIKALSFITNLVGQAHSPVHVAPSERAGGNNITVWFRDDPMTFHDFWSSKMIAARIIDAFNGSSSNYSQMLQQQSRVYWNVSMSMNSTAWLNETAQLNCQQGVWNNISQNANISESYYQEMVTIMERQLIMAGLRLAKFLDYVL